MKTYNAMGMSRESFKSALFVLLAAGSLHPRVPSALALVVGVLFAWTLGNPWMAQTRPFTQKLMSWSIVGLGAGLKWHEVMQAGLQGAMGTALNLLAILALGYGLGRWFHVEKETSVLINVGTAICGGSAIAAVAPVIDAKPHQTSVALALVFLLNAVALLMFPLLGHAFSLTEAQFGLWSALAIHDTSSVVGATLQYGPHALQVGTSVKLARALWIIPLTLGLGAYVQRARQSQEQTTKTAPKRPWFILGFVLMALAVTWFPQVAPWGAKVADVSKRGLVLAIFFIGANFDRKLLKTLDFRPFAQALALWLVTAAVSLWLISAFLN